MNKHTSSFYIIIFFLLIIIIFFYLTNKYQYKINLNPINFETFEDTTIQSFNEEKTIFSTPFTLKYYPFFLNDEEINGLLNICKNLFKQSTITQAKNVEVKDESRTSSSCFITGNNEKNNIITSIKQKASQLSGLPTENIEGLQVVKYQPGQQYKSHYDWFEKGHFDEKIGNRKATFFCYLNDDFDGGETFFPKMNYKKKGRKGSALFWKNINDSGDVDRNTLHAGLPVNSGTKYGLNIWIRENKV